MLTNCDVIVIFLIYGQFGAIQEPDSRNMICNTQIFISSFYLAKTENRTKRISNTALILLLSVKVLILPKNADISKIERVLELKGTFSETTHVYVLTYQLSSCYCNLNKFQAGGNFTPYPKKPTQISVKNNLKHFKVIILEGQEHSYF